MREFSDDGYSGGSFDRPAFQAMLRQLEQGRANLVITKDLSRLGRDMREASYYAEQFFPEHGIRCLALGDNFDTEHDNIMAPFLFAMNEVCLRAGSRKVKEVLRSKRESFGLKATSEELSIPSPGEMIEDNYQRFFQLARQYTHIEKLDRDTLSTFIDRIEIGPKVLFPRLKLGNNTI